jgi:hypothetical protein
VLRRSRSPADFPLVAYHLFGKQGMIKRGVKAILKKFGYRLSRDSGAAVLRFKQFVPVDYEIWI